MNQRPPITSLRQELPFSDPAFLWQTFEAFFCDYLNAQPEFRISRGGVEIVGRVIRARAYGRPGDVQEGIDLIAEMMGGEMWDFQCKRVKTWSPEQTRAAIAACQHDGARHFLLITCAVSEECYRVVSEHPDWELWDGREINRRFRDLDPSQGAEILFTHFGPNWAEAFFGISGNSPFVGVQTKFDRQLRAGARFHHRHALIGREDSLRQLDDFADNEKARVFLLTGRGGLGKSRLLLEWARAFQRKRPLDPLRFISDKNVDFGTALQATRQPLMLVFDDAHRLDEIRHALFPELPRRTETKLVLSLRPGPIGQVMQELVSAGFDTSEIITADPVKPLDGEQAMALVDVALQPKFLHLRHYLQAASRDCPLIAVIGAELINSGALVEADLRVAADVRTRVFASLLDDADSVRREFGVQETDDFLRLVALLGPVKLDASFLERAAPFLGVSSADRVSRMRDALDAVGLLLTTGAGTRITPDLLSDHLAYDACYDATGQSRTFAERLLAIFSPADFPKLLQHLAEAEWQAMTTKSAAASVVEPLWQWFRTRFENSTFYERQKQIQEWGNIAHLQPERTLELAELALSLTTAPEPTVDLLTVGEWNSHEYSLEWLPKMLGAVAEHHPHLLARCFDILWTLGKGKAVSEFRNNQSHPLSVINDVLRLKHWKGVNVQHAALDWIERLLAGDEWLHCANSPAKLFEVFFQPIFATSIELNWSSGRTFHFSSLPVHLERTAPLRERVRRLWRGLLARKSPHLASELIPTLEQACDIARNGIGGDVSVEFRAAWDAERLKCLAIFQEVAREFREPLIHFSIRRALMRDLRYGKESPTYRDACRELLKSLDDTLDFRIGRAAFGNAYVEFDRGTESSGSDWHTAMKAKWQTFNEKVAEDTHAASDWFDHLSELETRWRSFRGFQPNFREILARIADKNSTEGVAACERLIHEPDHPLTHTFNSIAMSATKGDARRRLELIRAAAESDSEMLRAAAVACCSWWRREGEIPEEAWQMLEGLAPASTPLVAERIANFVWWNEEAATLRDWQLIVQVPFAPDQTVLAGNIAARAADLVSRRKLTPTAESVAEFLTRFERLESMGGYELEHAFEELAKAFPVAVFLMLWQRNLQRKAGKTNIKSLRYDFDRIPLRNIIDAPEVAGIIADLRTARLRR